MPTVARLFIHPVKSCGAIELPRALLTPAGLQHDREWMIVTAEGRFLTQREVPRLALVAPALEDDALVLRAPGLEPLVVPLAVGSDRSCTVTVWDDRCQALDAGDAAAAWCSAWLQRDSRLVRFDPRHRRPTDARWSHGVAGESLFSDGFPLLVLAQASLDDLNARLPAPVGVERFRPNVLLGGCEPYAEDAHAAIEVPGVRLRLAKPCTRCVITATDQSTGVVTGDEPLRTLRRYRWDAQLRGVKFGQNAIVERGAGSVLEAGMSLAWAD